MPAPCRSSGTGRKRMHEGEGGTVSNSESDPTFPIDCFPKLLNQENARTPPIRVRTSCRQVFFQTIVKLGGKVFSAVFFVLELSRVSSRGVGGAR